VWHAVVVDVQSLPPSRLVFYPSVWQAGRLDRQSSGARLQAHGACRFLGMTLVFHGGS
jgi:hypothetical protein